MNVFTPRNCILQTQTTGVRPLRPTRYGQWRNDGVAAASSDGGPTSGRGPPTVLFYFKPEGRGSDLRK